MSPLENLVLRIETHLEIIYGKGGHGALLEQLLDTMRLREHFFEPVPYTNHWSEKDVALITYGDSVLPESGAPLKELTRFLKKRL